MMFLTIGSDVHVQRRIHYYYATGHVVMHMYWSIFIPLNLPSQKEFKNKDRLIIQNIQGSEIIELT